MITKKFKSKLAGVRYYQPAVDVLLKRENPHIVFEFAPSCEYDENAICVLDGVSGARLGYVEREIAEKVQDFDGVPVEITGSFDVSKRGEISLFFECRYEPIPVKSDEMLLEHVQESYDTAVSLLEAYVEEIRRPKYSSILSADYIGNAERALYLLDKNNSCLTDSDSVKRQKIIEDLLSGDRGMRDPLTDIMRGALVDYDAPNKPVEFFCFPNGDNINTSCRFCGKNVLFTGFWPEEKAQIAVVCEILNLQQRASVCQKLDFLICGSNAGPSKMKKADQMNIPIIGAADFISEITKR